jgi:hypothetical protein
VGYAQIICLSRSAVTPNRIASENTLNRFIRVRTEQVGSQQAVGVLFDQQFEGGSALSDPP